MFNASTIPVLEQVVKFTQARHGVLAGNLANLDTPGYRAADLSPQKFEEQLKQAIDARDQQTQFVSPGHLAAEPGMNLDETGQPMDSLLRHDDGSVSLEQQVAEISKNQAQHNLALTIMTSQFRLLQSAISERVV